MSATTEVNPRLLALSRAGVSPWVDKIGRSGAGYSFGTMVAAQSAGDLQTLRAHGFAADHAHLEGEPAPAVRALTRRIKRILDHNR